MARFTAKWDPKLLVTVMAEVLRVADPDRPDRVTQRAYNAARESAGFAGTPRAEKLAARFGMPWAKLIATVATEEHPAAVLSRADGRSRATRSQAEVVFALQAAARWLGTDHINQGTYERARREINASVQRRHLHGRSFAPLPAVSTVRHRMPFREAVAAAGLTISPRRAQRTMPRSDLVAVFVRHCGFSPNRAELDRFASHHRIRLTNEPHPAAVVAARDAFERVGQWFPPSVRGWSPPDAVARIERSGAEVRHASELFPATRRVAYSEDDLRSALRAAYDLLPPGESLTHSSYLAATEEHPHLPARKVVNEAAVRLGTTWEHLVEEVVRERIEALRR